MIRFAALVLLTIGVPLWADSPLDAVRGRMQKFVDSGEIAGAVTVIGRADGVLSHVAVGQQRLDPPTPMPTDALFRIASMTKPITAMGVMILAEEGKLRVDDPIEKHLPEFQGQPLAVSRGPELSILKPPKRPITIRDLLTHTSGLRRDFAPGFADLYTRRQRTLAEGVIAFSQQPLEFEPGARWAYCNPGIDTLGRVIEVVSGLSYEQFLDRRIVQPLGLRDTTFYPSEAQLQRLAVTYERKDGRLTPNPFVLIGSPAGAKYPVPAGGLYSTGADLARRSRLLLNQGALDGVRILRPETIAAMTRVQTGDLDCGFVPGMSFGYGFGVVREPGGATERLSPGSYGHGGAFGTQWWIDPVRGTFTILLIQRRGLPNADASEMRRELQAIAASAPQ